MNRRPELLKKTGKSSLALKNFVNNLKENDLHYENKQITQCVFLGVLRLKPVPSVFCKNVPSVSANTEINKHKRIKSHGNRALTKCGSKKANNDKVLIGRITKKNPEKVKAAVKKPNIKIKLKTKSKVNIEKSVPSTSSGKPEMSKSSSPDSVIAKTTLTLNPVISPTKFNPVQNLFDKLKQKVNEGQNEAGPSRVTRPIKVVEEKLKLKPTVKYSVCKITANVHSNKNLKKVLGSKTHERSPLPSMSTSPITVSDTESNGKKDKDEVIILDETNSKEGDTTEDIIIVNDDPKEKILPRNKLRLLNRQSPGIKSHKFKQLDVSISVESTKEERIVSEEVIFVRDEPRGKEMPQEKYAAVVEQHDQDRGKDKNEVIVIDEVKEVRVSPRLKKAEEKNKQSSPNTNKIVDNIIVTDESKLCQPRKRSPPLRTDFSKTQQLNITIDSQDVEKESGNATPRLLKTVECEESSSPLAVKKETLTSDKTVKVEKPRKRKSSTISSTLLPPMLLNAPMLLRSELAPKKTNYVIDKPKPKKTRDKTGRCSKSFRNDFELIQNADKTKWPTKSENISIPQDVSALATTPDSESDEVICLSDLFVKKSTNQGVNSNKLLQHIPSGNINNNKNSNIIETIEINLPQQNVNKESLKNIKIHSTSNSYVEKSRQKTSNDKNSTNQELPEILSTIETSNNIIIDDGTSKTEKLSPRLLRSESSRQKVVENVEENKKNGVNQSEEVSSSLNENGQQQQLGDITMIALSKEAVTNNNMSPRTLRSNQAAQQKSPAAAQTVTSKEDNISFGKSKLCPGLLTTHQKNRHVDLDEIAVVTERKARKCKEKTDGKVSQLTQVSTAVSPKVNSIETREVEDVVVLIHDEPKGKVSQSSQSISKEDPSEPDVVVIFSEEQKDSPTSGISPRSLRSATNKKPNNTPQTSPRILEKGSPLSNVRFTKNISENSTKEVSTGEQEKQTEFHRHLRSELIKGGHSGNSNIQAVVTELGGNMSPRLLRSERYSPNVSQCLSPKSTERKKLLQKKAQKPGTAIDTIVLQEQNRLEVDYCEIKSPNKGISVNSETTEVKMEAQEVALLKSPTTRKIGKNGVSKKVMLRKKKETRNKKGKSLITKIKLSTPMLLRSELAQLKNGEAELKKTRVIKKKIKLKMKSTNSAVGCQLDNQVVNLPPKETQKVKKSPKIKDAAAIEDITSVKDFPLEVVQPKKKRKQKETLNLKNKPSKNVIVADNKKDNATKGSSDKIIIGEVPAALEKMTGNNKSISSKKNQTINKSEKSITEVPVESASNVKTSTPKSSSSQNKKPAGKRKSPCVKPEEKAQVEPLDNQTELHKGTSLQITDLSNTSSKNVDITIFDFDESEPEVPPLRLSTTPRKEKSKEETNKKSTESAAPVTQNVTPESKKQKLVDEATTKVQAKANLLPRFDENSVQPNFSKKPLKDNGAETRKNTKNAKPKQGTRKAAGNKKNSPLPKQNESISSEGSTGNSTSPLRQTTIMDMFNRVMLKKEKNSNDSVSEVPSSEEVPSRKDNTVNADMPPPACEVKPVLRSNGEEDQNDPYDEDSDCESRMEWIPEEYAEYKFKYSAKKLMTYKPIHKCKICLLILPTYYKLSKHKEEHAKTENPYNCKQCDQAFSSIDDLTAHLRIHKGKHPYMCKKCDVGFWSKKSLDAHTPIHVLRKVKQPNKRFRCDVCAKEFSKLCDMERHTRVHTGEKPCVCNICNKRFQQSHNLSKHLLTHLHVKPFHCEICNKQFGRNDVLNRHLLTHSVEKPIKCPLCPKGFIRQTQLNNHMKKNHPDAARINTGDVSAVACAK